MVDTGTGTGRTVAGRYRITRELGRGGMGVVWLAEDEVVARQVALKELRAGAGLAQDAREEFTKRALAEARNAARVHHPNAVALYDVIPASPDDDAVYLVMELVDALTLEALITRDKRLSDERVARIGLQLLDVLDAAHALGVVHRDVKPLNIMVDEGDVVKLTDFGIAHHATDTRLTRAGVVGTQAYLAPELFDADPISPAADLWSLGASLYHAVSGAGPFERDSTSAMLRAILIDEPPAPHCGAPLRAAIAGMLTRDPAERATSAQARHLLEQVANGTSGSAYSRGTAKDTWELRPTSFTPSLVRQATGNAAIPEELREFGWPQFFGQLLMASVSLACVIVVGLHVQTFSWISVVGMIWLFTSAGWLVTILLRLLPMQPPRVRLAMSGDGLDLELHRWPPTRVETIRFGWQDIEALTVLGAKEAEEYRYRIGQRLMQSNPSFRQSVALKLRDGRAWPDGFTKKTTVVSFRGARLGPNCHVLTHEVALTGKSLRAAMKTAGVLDLHRSPDEFIEAFADVLSPR